VRSAGYRWMKQRSWSSPLPRTFRYSSGLPAVVPRPDLDQLTYCRADSGKAAPVSTANYKRTGGPHPQPWPGAPRGGYDCMRSGAPVGTAGPRAAGCCGGLCWRSRCPRVGVSGETPCKTSGRRSGSPHQGPPWPAGDPTQKAPGGAGPPRKPHPLHDRALYESTPLLWALLCKATLTICQGCFTIGMEGDLYPDPGRRRNGQGW
jgi:hypothetical protein